MPMGEWRCATTLLPDAAELAGRCRRERSRKSRPYVRLLRFGLGGICLLIAWP
jgi:hypothetical protein